MIVDSTMRWVKLSKGYIGRKMIVCLIQTRWWIKRDEAHQGEKKHESWYFLQYELKHHLSCSTHISELENLFH